MDRRRIRLVIQALGIMVAVALVLGGQAPELHAQPADPDRKLGPDVMPAALAGSPVRVVVALADPRGLNARSTDTVEPAARSAEAGSVRSAVVSSLSPTDFQETVRFRSVPALAGLATPAGLRALARHPGVVKVDLDVGGKATLAQSVPLVGGDDWHVRGNRGQGVVVAVLDTGLDPNHPDVNDGLVGEACFLNAGSGGKCPNMTDRQTGPGSAVDDQNHGTWVTGVIASNGVHASVGMAPDAQYVAVKVLDSTGTFASTADIVAALDWIFTDRPDVQVINMSLGTFATFAGDCDNTAAFTMAFAASINALRNRATNPVLSVASSGNSALTNAMGLPACISSVLSVGATTKTDAIAAFSNASTTLDLLAPGESIVTSQRGGTTNTVNGTSFASPHVAGCAALLIRVGEAVTPAQLETRLRTSPVQITDARNNLTYPRLDCTPPPPGVTVSQTGGTTSVAEGGATDTFTVVLNNPPTANVTIALNPGTQVTAAPSPLLFTNANWNVPQVVTVAAVDDPVVEGAHNATIALTATSPDSGYNLLAIPSVPVSIADNDTAGVTVTQSGGTTNVVEGGATDTFTVALTSQPTANVTVTLNPGAQLTVATSPLLFTSANWNVPQTVTVTAIDDVVVEGAHSGSVGFTVASTDTNYANLAVAAVPVTITDNDTPGVTVTQSGGTTNVVEGGATDTFSVVLTSQPTANVTIALNPGTQVTAAPSPLLFTSANWNVPQTVTVTAVDDAIAEGTHSGTVGFTVASTDTNYANLAVAAVPVAITDNETAGLSVGDATVTEGDVGTGPLTFTVTLTPPSAQVVTVQYVTANGPVPDGATGGAACAPGVDYVTTSGTLTFQPLDTTRTIAVTVCADALLEANETLLVSLSGATNAAITDGQAAGTITNDDQAGTLTFSAATVSVPENAGSVTLTVERSGGTGPTATGSTVNAAPGANVPSGSVRPNPPPGAGAATPGTITPSALSPITVSFATADQTAKAGQDYVATAGTLTFGVGETSKTIVIPILTDSLQEGPESFIVTLAGPTGGAGLGAQATITVVIVDTTHGAAGAPSDDSADDEREERERETEEERRQRARTNQGNRDDDAVEGDVIETRCDLAWPAVVIANRDGDVEVRLIKEAQRACSSIQVGDYLEADGEKQHEFLFHADSVEIRRDGERVR